LAGVVVGRFLFLIALLAFALLTLLAFNGAPLLVCKVFCSNFYRLF
jgi:hypothetical protein